MRSGVRKYHPLSSPLHSSDPKHRPRFSLASFAFSSVSQFSEKPKGGSDLILPTSNLTLSPRTLRWKGKCSSVMIGPTNSSFRDSPFPSIRRRSESTLRYAPHLAGYSLTPFCARSEVKTPNRQTGIALRVPIAADSFGAARPDQPSLALLRVPSLCLHRCSRSKSGFRFMP
jgi:hypothetical protein